MKCVACCDCIIIMIKASSYGPGFCRWRREWTKIIKRETQKESIDHGILNLCDSFKSVLMMLSLCRFSLLFDKHFSSTLLLWLLCSEDIHMDLWICMLTIWMLYCWCIAFTFDAGLNVKDDLSRIFLSKNLNFSVILILMLLITWHKATKCHFQHNFVTFSQNY